MTKRSIIDDTRGGRCIFANDLPLVPVFLANKQLAREYRQQWNCSFQGGISLIVLERGFSGQKWPYAVPERLRSRVTTCYVVYPLDCEHYRNLVTVKTLRMLDYGRLRDVCENWHKLSEQVEHELKDANQEVAAHVYRNDDLSSQNEALAQLAGVGNLNDYDDDGDDDFDDQNPCDAIDILDDLSSDLHMQLSEIIAEFTILKSMHFVFSMRWECASPSLVWPKMPHGPEFREALQHLMSHQKAMSCVILRATTKEDYADWLCGRRELGTYAVYTKEKGWRAGMARAMGNK